MKKIIINKSDFEDSYAKKLFMNEQKRFGKIIKISVMKNLSKNEEVKNVLIIKAMDIETITSMDFYEKTEENFSIRGCW